METLGHDMGTISHTTINTLMLVVTSFIVGARAASSSTQHLTNNILVCHIKREI